MNSSTAYPLLSVRFSVASSLPVYVIVFLDVILLLSSFSAQYESCFDPFPENRLDCYIRIIYNYYLVFNSRISFAGRTI